jgi:hypothetical protein
MPTGHASSIALRYSEILNFYPSIGIKRLILSIAPDSFENCGALQKIFQGEATMTTTFDRAMPVGVMTPGILDRERIIATKGFNRWLVPPAALCIHLCIGMAYGFSVFWLPLSRALGITASKTCPDMSLVQELFTTTRDWRVASMGWMFTLFFVILGVSAAMRGGWLERVGPRKAGVVAACCWAGGLLLGAIGIYVHQLWLMWLGSGVIGGVGLGLGYISNPWQRRSSSLSYEHRRLLRTWEQGHLPFCRPPSPSSAQGHSRRARA